ncbi:zinc finger protein OZF-like isoform X1, partial [Biomphalaria pfeifferi]
MDDMKQNTNERRNVIKIEKIDWTDTLENSFTGQTYEITYAEEAQTSKEQTHSRSKMDDMEQDFTNDLKNILKIEKIETSLHSETQELFSSSQTLEDKEKQKKRVNQNEEMTLNQDLHVINTLNKDGHSGNLKDKEHNVSYRIGTHHLVYAEKKSGQSHLGAQTFCTSSKVKNDEMIHS